jgi:SAM-dependent methyltransferase
MEMKRIVWYLLRPQEASRKILKGLKDKRHPTNKGYCPICEADTHFIEWGTWLREDYKCKKCKSIPRQRALISVLNQNFPQWKDLAIHESSPGGRSSDYIKRLCRQYTASQFYPDLPLGTIVGNFTCEDLSRLTFESNQFDLLVSQDVFEHVINPESAFSEIARVLKPGGAHIFTMPWYPELKSTRIRAVDKEGTIVHLEEPVYHGNPISKDGSLVTRDWGLDFTDIIFKTSGLSTTIYLIRDRSLGIDGKFLEVFVSRKSEQ